MGQFKSRRYLYEQTVPPAIVITRRHHRRKWKADTSQLNEQNYYWQYSIHEWNEVLCSFSKTHMHTVWVKKNPPVRFSGNFSQTVGNF